MFVSANDLNKAVSRAYTIASIEKKGLDIGIAFTIQDGSLEIYYNGGTRALVNTIPATVRPDELRGTVVLDFKRLYDTLNFCKSSGKINVGDLEMNFVSNPVGTGTVHIHVVKTIDREVDGQVTNHIISTNTYDLTWLPIDKVKTNQKALGIKAYEDMFSESGASAYTVDDLASLINSITIPDAKAIFSSEKFGGIFAAESNTNYMQFVKNYDKSPVYLHLNMNYAKALINVVKSLDVSDIKITTLYSDDNKAYAYLFYTEDHSVSIYLKSAPMNGSLFKTLLGYISPSYKTYNFTILTEVLVDNLKAINSLSMTPNGIMRFKANEEGKVVLNLSVENTNGSINNEYNIICDAFNSKVEVVPGHDIVAINANLKIILDMLSSCRETFTALDIDINNNKTLVRVGFIDEERQRDVLVELAVERSDSSTTDQDINETNTDDQTNIFDSFESNDSVLEDAEVDALEEFISNLTIDDKLELRSKYLTVTYYTTVKPAS